MGEDNIRFDRDPKSRIRLESAATGFTAKDSHSGRRITAEKLRVSEANDRGKFRSHLEDQTDRFRPLDLRSLVLPFVQRWMVILAAVFLPAAAAWYYSYQLPPSYEASATLLLDRERVLLGDIADVSATANLADSVHVSNEIAVLLSLPVLEDAAMRIASAGADRSIDGTTKAVVELREQIDVKRDLNSMAVVITATAGSAVEAANLANVVTSAYLDHKVQVASETTERTLQWIDREIERLRKLTDELNRNIQQQRERLLKEGLSDAELVNRQIRSVADASVSARLRKSKISSAIDDLKRQEAAGVLSTADRRDLRDLEAQNRIAADEISAFEVETERLKKTALDGAEANRLLENMLRETNASQQLLTNLLIRRNEIFVRREGISPGARIINTAIAPEHPAGPRRKLFVGVAAFAGLMSIVGAILLWDIIVQRFQTLGAMQKALRLPLLGAVYSRLPLNRTRQFQDYDIGAVGGLNSIEYSLLEGAAEPMIVALFPTEETLSATVVAHAMLGSEATVLRDASVVIVAPHESGDDIKSNMIPDTSLIEAGGEVMRQRLLTACHTTLLVLPTPDRSDLSYAWASIADRVIVVTKGKKPKIRPTTQIVDVLLGNKAKAIGLVTVL
ncbi:MULTISPECIES: Wzz/FepE/Etk N-terminal domain-containing protein [unclassified Ruegeria]|uniref:GumC family protein n=1 Tax=unclassified Ruegeria TaxID=2625375 RepID=UPI001489191C|nr:MULTISPECIES: Wzz/FepE/Etk N-terminal domain-containing protein [unclassified Ruegeria]